jgi:hypothetical protein
MPLVPTSDPSKANVIISPVKMILFSAFAAWLSRPNENMGTECQMNFHHLP